jgi:hypothetical protein
MQYEVVWAWVALTIDEVSVGMIVKPAEESAVVCLEDLAVLRETGVHERIRS